MKRVLAVLTALLLILGIVSCGKKTDESTTATTAAADATTTDGTATTSGSADQNTDQTDAAPSVDAVDREGGTTLVVANQDVNEIFNPFFYKSVPDKAIIDNTQVSLIHFDAHALPSQLGMAECDWDNPEVTGEGENQEIVYKLKLKDNVKTPDGEALTADDVIFTAKVLLDPNYTGNATLFASSLVGAKEYKYDDANYAESLKKIDEEVAAYEPTDEEIEEKAQALFDEYSQAGYEVQLADFQKGGSEFEGETLAGLTTDKKNALTKEYIEKNLADGIDVEDIKGIVKVDDFNMELHFAGLNPRNLENFSFAVVPRSYYGEGFTKGDLSGVEAKNKVPYGAGPYKFLEFKNNVGSFEANPNYYLGEPKIKKLKIQTVDNTNQLGVVAKGDVDIAEPSASPENVAEAEKHENVHVELIDNNGYGYIGVNSERISDKNVRKGIFHLLDRKPAVDAYFGELASVIERPISRVNWAYPQDATEYYGFNTEKAMEYFTAAGYELVDGKLMKNGSQLSITCSYPGGNDDSHPVKPVFAKLKEEGEKLGMAVNLQNLDGTTFFQDLDAGNLDMWAAAWQATPDPDMTQVYSSNGPSNHYKIKRDDLDQLIADGLKTVDREERKKIYAKALDIIMDEACEMPFYQRKNMVVINSDVVDLDTMPAELTPYQGVLGEIQTLELK